MEHFADIEGPVRIGLLGILLMVLAGMAVATLLVFLIRRLARRRKRKSETAATARRSPFEIAIERLQSLRSSLPELGAEPFTVEVADIVRDYLEESLEVPAREQTSEEFLQTLQGRTDLPATLNESMPPFLEQCDRVKFARQSLAGEQRETLLGTARKVVENTDAHLKAREASPATMESS